MLILYGGLLALAGWRMLDTPRGFIPQQDQRHRLDVDSAAGGAPRSRARMRSPSRRSTSF